MKPINQITRRDVQRFEENVAFDIDCRSDGGTLDHYQTIATKSAIYPGQGTALGLAYVALKLNGEAGEFAEHVGKAMRDDKLSMIAPFLDALIFCSGSQDFQSDGQAREGWLRICKPLLDKRLDQGNDTEELTPERRALIIKEIGDVLWYVSAACNELGITLSEAATENLRKLCDRTERDALRGSGDER